MNPPRNPFRDNRQYTSLIESAFVFQWAIEIIDDLKDTPFYAFKLKSLLNQTQKEILDIHAKTLYRDAGKDAAPIMEQQEHGLQTLRMLFGITIAAGDLPEGQQPLFFLDINKVFIRYGLEVSLDANGTFSIIAPRYPEGRQPGPSEGRTIRPENS